MKIIFLKKLDLLSEDIISDSPYQIQLFLHIPIE